MIQWLKLLFHVCQYEIVKENPVTYTRYRQYNDPVSQEQIEYHCRCKHCGKMKFYTY